MLFLHEKDTHSKICRETLFETVIKEKLDVLFSEYHIFNILYNICVFLHAKVHLFQKSPEKRCFKRVLKIPDVLFLNIIFLNLCRILCYFYMKRIH